MIFREKEKLSKDILNHKQMCVPLSQAEPSYYKYVNLYSLKSPLRLISEFLMGKTGELQHKNVSL